MLIGLLLAILAAMPTKVVIVESVEFINGKHTVMVKKVPVWERK